MLRIVVVSPLPAVRAGLRVLLGAAAGVAVTGEAVGLEHVLAGGIDAGPDVVVVDTGSALDLAQLALFDQGQRAAGVVILGPVPDETQLLAALAGRAWAYLPREATGDQLLAAVRAVGHGMVAVDADLAGELLTRAGLATASPDVSSAAHGEELTAREREVLEIVALGLPNKLIARRLGISEHTVKFHVAGILSKLGAGSRTEAVHVAARRGLVSL